MNKITHAAAKKVFSGVVDYALGQVNKNPDEAYEKIIDIAEKNMKDLQTDVNWEYIRKVACNPEYTLNRYITSMVKELHNVRANVEYLLEISSPPQPQRSTEKSRQ